MAIHASVVEVGGRGVLIRGASGSGKSSLALALLAADPEHTRLVADDQVVVAVREGVVLAKVPAAIAGLLEVRGVGVVRRPYVSAAPVALVVDLCPPAECPRCPEPAEARVEIDGAVVPRIKLPVGLPDGALRVHAALEHYDSLPHPSRNDAEGRR